MSNSFFKYQSHGYFIGSGSNNQTANVKVTCQCQSRLPMSKSSANAKVATANAKVAAANAKDATVLRFIPASTDTVESEGRQMKQCSIKYFKIKKYPP
jgi:hypothetical protein